jgi:hypothetical protein
MHPEPKEPPKWLTAGLAPDSQNAVWTNWAFPRRRSQRATHHFTVADKILISLFLWIVVAVGWCLTAKLR